MEEESVGFQWDEFLGPRSFVYLGHKTFNNKGIHSLPPSLGYVTASKNRYVCVSS